MPKRNLDSVTEDKLELEDFQDEPKAGIANSWHRLPIWLLASGGLLLLVLVTAGSFELFYAGKVLPGVSADGVYLGGLSESAAVSRVSVQTGMYMGDAIAITNGKTSTEVPIKSLGLSYNDADAASLAIKFGGQGSVWNQIHQQLRAFFGRTTDYSVYTYNDSLLIPYLMQVDGSSNSTVQDASLNFDGNTPQVVPGYDGSRLDVGLLTHMIDDRLASGSAKSVTAPVYQQAPNLATAPLQAAVGQVSTYLSAPITLAYSGTTQTISQTVLTSWIQAQSVQSPSFLQTYKLGDLYPPLPSANLTLSQAAVSKYVANLASTLNKSPVNAQLTMTNGQVALVAPSQDGLALNQSEAVSDIIASLSRTGAERTVNLNIQPSVAAVNENNYTTLGISTLISTGETYFPESPAGRLTNVSAGAARFNNALVAPGQVFSMGAQLGTVDAATGYVPELVILGNSEVLQYGGGLCQVNTTLFRAALAAGLPIDEREAHAFAISYYQWPYTAPGVDATIYYPQVDLKFTNDTGHYILMQTIMNGYYLTFNFYGTKVESGVIRGPYFVTGSNNVTQASHTVFYRDVYNNAGQKVRTDTFNSYYQPSTDFPYVATSN